MRRSPNSPRTCRVVSADSRTVPGLAAVCSRAARLAVSPTTRNSPDARSARPVTTISPVSMPTRICRRTPCEASTWPLSRSSAPTIDSAALTARAASSSRDR
jgi:hypothetical protein